MTEQSDTAAAGPAPDFDAVVLAGGAGSRLGGTDKPALEVGGRTLLDAALTACAAARRTVVVGPARPVRRAVDWTREEPAGAGPAAALAAGLAGCSSPYTVVLAADLPFIDATVVHSLWITISSAATSMAPGRLNAMADGAVAVDESGRAQWLTACYRRSALLDRIRSFAPEDLVGLSLRRLLAGLRWAGVAIPARAAFDCDTWEQIDAARGLGTGPDAPAGKGEKEGTDK